MFLLCVFTNEPLRKVNVLVRALLRLTEPMAYADMCKRRFIVAGDL